MPELRNYRIFISHAWRYNEEYYRLVELLDRAPYFIYANYSVPEHDAFAEMTSAQLTDQIQAQIRPVQVVLIISGLYVNYSEWIQYEMDCAYSLHKPILAIQPWGSTNMPRQISQIANEIVGWNTDSIVDAIRRLA
ncbi:TIR domain-containing protein [Turneriella parva]|uniref:Thoeris protein ThsB TIR-like domain-containing protein n=1 Tax=Turneriella parva (strain ATCC BAA-1111 / DSM 21527 / NCTC 11395 / H) TaxID=869212 RepID=I4B4D8_TURPD|nr:TIR domain-containing protein [Turneriella parva]AFM12145.1 protein of unknown function DUF1863 [Turneriella parva DSM 21527]